MEYPIVFRENIIGSASVQQQGMCVVIRCCCRSEESLNREIYLGSLALGKCVPDGTVYTLVRRIPKRDMPVDPEFSLREEKRESHMVLREDTPLCYLEKLPYTKFAYENGHAVLLISDQRSSSNNTGQ